MSQRERDRLRVLSMVTEGKRSQAEAARLLRLSTRQVRRLQRRLATDGDRGVVHRLRGRPSNHQRPESLRRQVVSIFKRQMGDFGALLASEKLRDQGLAVPVGTLRDWLRAEGLLEPRRRRDQHRRRRERRQCFGELVQGDGSHHDWLEGRGPWMVLVAFIDDATSKMTARFYPAETTEAYMDLLGGYLRRHGRMSAMYVDRDSIFRAEDHHPSDPRPTLTQFSRALGELQIELILAYSPQAKGRIERFFQTAQDRLVKELRLAGARTMQEANDVLEKTFIPWFNRWKSIKASSPNDAHRPLHPSMNLSSILSIQEKRRVCNDYTIRLDNQVYQLLKPALPGMRGGRVVIEKRLDGTLQIRLKKRYVAYHLIGPADRPGALPPSPRSLTHLQTPAGSQKKKGSAAATAKPSAVRLTFGRSGRTPAEPCPPKGNKSIAAKQPYVPVPDHPWRKFRLRGSIIKTGHSYPPQTADSSIRA
jgi:hypothetical protein